MLSKLKDYVYFQMYSGLRMYLKPRYSLKNFSWIRTVVGYTTDTE